MGAKDVPKIVYEPVLDEKFGPRSTRNRERGKNFLKFYSENTRLETRIFYKPFFETETRPRLL